MNVAFPLASLAAVVAVLAWLHHRRLAWLAPLREEARALRVKLDQLSERNNQLSRILQRLAERHLLLGHVHRELSEHALDLDALLSTLAQRVAHAVGDAAGVCLPGLGQSALRACEASTPGLREESLVLLQAAAPTLTPLVMHTGRPHAPPCDTLIPERSALAVPLHVREGRAIGALLLLRRPGAPPYSPEEMELCEQVAERAAYAIDTALQYRARESCLAIAAHELRGQAQMLLRALGDAEGVRSREAIQGIERQAARLVNDLLEASTPRKPDLGRYYAN